MSLFQRIFRNVKAQVGTLYNHADKTQNEEFDRFSSDAYSHKEFRKKKKGHSESVDQELMDCYATLETPYGSDLQTVRSAWKRLLKQYHPDRHHKDPTKHEVATNIAAEITASYKYIENSLKNKK